MGPLN